MGRVCPGSVLSLNPESQPALNCPETVRTKIISVDKNFKQKFSFLSGFWNFSACADARPAGW
jgi:hypothetical protein